MVHKSKEKSVQTQTHEGLLEKLLSDCSATEYEGIIDDAIFQITCFSEFKQGGGLDVDIYFLRELRNFFKSIHQIQNS